MKLKHWILIGLVILLFFIEFIIKPVQICPSGRECFTDYGATFFETLIFSIPLIIIWIIVFILVPKFFFKKK